MERTEEPKLEALEERLDAIQAENRRLSALVDRLLDRASGSVSSVAPNGSTGTLVAEVMDRRKLLKRLGVAAAAGVGVAAGSSLLKPNVAHAATGGNLIIGQANTADAADTTSLSMTHSSALPNPTFSAVAGGAGQPAVAVSGAAQSAPLLIVPVSGAITRGYDGALGTRAVSGFADLYFIHDTGSNKNDDISTVGKIYTSQFANFLDFISPPIRVLDTRDAGLRPGLPGGTDPINGTYTVDVSGAIPAGSLGVLGTLTSVSPTANGFLTIWKSGDPPETSNSNFAAGGAPLATLAMTEVTGTRTMQLLAAAGESGSVHVIFDVIAAIVPS